MLGILIFCLGIMYTPGPVNILSINCGIQKKYISHIPFCIGVGLALFFWFMLTGYAGSVVINSTFLPILSFLGVMFILYLAWKLMASNVDLETGNKCVNELKIRDGFLMQLLNPKSAMVVLPVTTVQFPALGIHAGAITIWSSGLALLGAGAPFIYAIGGTKLSRYITKEKYFRYFNILMSLMLVALAVEMAYKDVYTHFI